MKPRALDWVVCPICASDFALGDAEGHAPTAVEEVSPASLCDVCRAPEGRRTNSAAGNCESCYGLEVERAVVVCSAGHAFPVDGGVPRLMLDRQLESADSRSIRESFSAQWDHYDYDAEDRTWGQTIEKRLEDFLRMVDHRPQDLSGKLVLDAGCGNGVLSRAITRWGCEVLAADISDSVEGAYRHFAAQGNDRTHFLQADLMNPPFRPETFDIVFCAGVIIVTPDSKWTFDQVVRALAPGGTMFVWLYWRESGIKYRIKTALRRILSPMPLVVKRAVSFAFVAQAMARQQFRVLLRRQGDRPRLKWREHFVVQHDFFTPRYRWEHKPDEVHQWYRDLGFTDIKTTEIVDAGFGVAARKPAPVAVSAADAVAAQA